MNSESREIIKGLAAMAWADGEVSPEEHALLLKVLSEAGASPEDMEEFSELLGRSETEADPSNVHLDSVLEDEESRLNVMRALLIMSFMDGVLSFAEFTQIEKFAKDLNINSEQLDALRNEALEAAKALQTED